MITHLAQSLPLPPMNEVGTWFWCGAGFMAFAVLVLTFVEKVRSVFGRKPTLDDDFQKLRDQLKGLAPSEKVDKLLELYAGAATKTELAAVTSLVADYVRKAEFDREIETLKTDLHNQITEMRAYVHEGIHGLRDDVQAMRSSSELQREGLHDRINTLVEVTYELRGLVNAIADRQGGSSA